MTNPTVAELIARSNRLGADPKNTNYAGGNTSAKGTETDPVTGEHVELLWVKGSGGDLGTLTEAGPGRAAAGPDARAGRRLPGRRARGRDGRGVRLLPARQGRRGAVDRHRDARPGRRRARRPPAPRLRHRDRDRRRRRGADQGDLRRQGRLGAVAAARASSSASTSPRSRRPTRRRSAASSAGTASPRGATPARSPRRNSLWIIDTAAALHRRARQGRAVRPGARRVRRAARGRAPRQGRRARPDHPRASPPRTGRWSGTSPTPTWCSTSWPPPSTRGWPALGTSARTTSCAPRSSRWCSTCPPTASVEESIARLEELHGAYREDYQGYYDRNATAGLARRSAAPTR